MEKTQHQHLQLHAVCGGEAKGNLETKGAMTRSQRNIILPQFVLCQQWTRVLGQNN